MFDAPVLHAGNNGQLVNTEAERALLGALLAKPQLLTALPSGFLPDHYAYADHEEVHRVLVEVSRPGVPAGIPVMQAWAINDPDRKAVIAGLLAAAVGYGPGHVSEYGAAITEMYRRRQIVSLADALREGAFANSVEQTVDGTIARAMATLDGICAGQVAARGPVSLDEAMDGALRKADEASKRQGPVGLSTGFQGIDEHLGGLEDGTVTVIGGRPGMGKSAMGLRMALNTAKQGIGVLGFSLEMTADEQGRRTLSVESGVPIHVMKKGLMDSKAADKLVQARQRLGNLPMTIEDSGGLTVSMMMMRARAAHRRHGLGLIFVDHLNIIRPDDGDARHGGTWAVGRVSNAMKRMAKEFNCPVILLAQLNRGVEGREDKRPGLSDLRQAGDVEQDADNVLFVYRPEYYMGSDPVQLSGENDQQFANRATKWHDAKRAAAGKAEVIIAKVRDGATGTAPLLFNGETTTFSEMNAHV